MDVLVIGAGGREHVLAWKIKQSPNLGKLYCAPGNGGIAEIAECVDIKADDIDGLLKFAKDKKIGLTMVGPEAPLVKGVVDVFEKEGLNIFGPSRAAAQLEGSKIFAKEFMQRYGIPTAMYRSCDSLQKARDTLRDFGTPVVIKADGLAAGKGVFICPDMAAAEEALDQIMEQKVFKDAGRRIVIEECLEGEEASILALSDGEHYVILDSSQDHKRIFDDDMGPNTGGMGAYSPAPVVSSAVLQTVEEDIIAPVIRGMEQDGMPFKGVLYAGLMITSDGPKVLEFNVRFGDPETQAVLPRLKNDLLEVLSAGCDGTLNRIDLVWDDRPCVSVVMCSGGYPGKYETGFEIKGLKDAGKLPDTVIFHAGTRKEGGKIVTSGGRVFNVTALGGNIEGAIASAYRAVEKISFQHAFFRRDIGAKAVKNVIKS